ncbi:MAG: RagB/SusD family nutrient uptake outer membrane protein [Prevotella sp.]|jgi:hypothetical protein|nr:RagB/SusD family nutrient uptake outer membrane protein [Prevotella sp.]
MKLNIYVLLVLLVFTANSCSDFLDKSPDDELTMEMVFNDKTRTEDWLAGVYTAIPDPYMPMLKNYDVYADDVSPSAGWEVYDWDGISKIKGNWNSESSWHGNFWNNFPARIRAAYIFLDKVKALPEQNVTQADVNLMKAEARFLIAYYYYLLVNTYGSVPLQTWLSNFTDSADALMIGQNPYDEVVDWIDNELKEVAKLLPAYYTDTQKYGRATSVACHAIRARMLLFAASPLVNGNDDPKYAGYVNDKGIKIFNSIYDPGKWVKAKDACKELIDLAHTNGYKLYHEYNDDGTIDPFMSYSNAFYTEFNQGNKEILFARPDCDYGGYSNHAMPRGMKGNGGLGVTQSLVDAFFMNNGLPPITGHNADGSPVINAASGYSETGFSSKDDIRKTKWIEGVQDASANNRENVVVPAGNFNMYVNREPRFYVSVRFNDSWSRIGGRNVNFYMNGTDGGPTHDAPQNGYLLRKRVHPNQNPQTGANPYRPGILYRLGEAYLNYAEALNEAEPANTAEILNYINLIRERAGIPLYGSGDGQIPAPASPAEMKLAIKRERRVEMNCEYAVRFDDIRRWKEIDLLKGDFYGMNYYGTEKSDDKNNENAFYVRKPYITRAFEKKNYWLPIHQNQIDKNPNLRQLPYW